MQMTQRITEGRYLTFSLAHEEYGVEMHRVLEILQASGIEPLSEGSSLIKGLLPWRGQKVPVLDLRRCLGKDEAERSSESCIVTVTAKGWEGNLSLMALLVDGVREVVQVWNENLEQASVLEEDPREEFLKGLVQCDERLVILLDLDRLARLDEVEEAKLP